MCVFCEKYKAGKFCRENKKAFAVLDEFPVGLGHTLICPKRHISSCFQLTAIELRACLNLLIVEQEFIRGLYSDVAGFNVGFNCGKVAGQTVEHCHIHLIPRRKGDTLKPKGGIRGCIPERMSYETTARS